MAKKNTYQGDGLKLYNYISAKGFSVSEAMEKLKVSRGTLYNYYEKQIMNDALKSSISLDFGVHEDVIFGNDSNESTDKFQSQHSKSTDNDGTRKNQGATRQHVTGDQIRHNKAFAPQEQTGLIIVPIAAQAGYSKHFTDPVYINQLKTMMIPNFPYQGEKYRGFEIEGDSMTYVEGGKEQGLKNGYLVIGERVSPEDWAYSIQYYVHVIITEDSVMIKRLWRDKDGTYVMISDNPAYPQKRIHKEDIKELWIMKRYLGWDMAPPREYEITA